MIELDLEKTDFGWLAGPLQSSKFKGTRIERATPLDAALEVRDLTGETRIKFRLVMLGADGDGALVEYTFR